MKRQELTIRPRHCLSLGRKRPFQSFFLYFSSFFSPFLGQTNSWCIPIAGLAMLATSLVLRNRCSFAVAKRGAGMRIKREKSVVSTVDYRTGKPLSTEGIEFEGKLLSHLVATAPFPYLGIWANLISKGSRPPPAWQQPKSICSRRREKSSVLPSS